MYFTLFRSTFLKKVHFVTKLFVPSKRNYRFRTLLASETIPRVGLKTWLRIHPSEIKVYSDLSCRWRVVLKSKS